MLENQQANSSTETISPGEEKKEERVVSKKRKSWLAFFVFFLVILGLGFFLWSFNQVNSNDSKVNLLILGKGGEGHSAPELTDTLILASVSLKESKAITLSLPRDIWLAEIRAKLNSAYYWGKEKPELGGSISFAKETVGKITGLPVHYALVLDFSAFRQIVDVLGGVEVEVERAFTDTKYPILGKENDLCGGDKEYKCRYETVHFEPGRQLMDGETALKFVRSRNGDNGENTDLAREARQQKVIAAIKEKSLSWKTIFNPIKLIKLWQVARKSIETDLDFWSTFALLKRLLVIDGRITSLVIPEELLLNPPKGKRYDYQYVFVPKAGNWDEVKLWLGKLIK